MIPSKLLEVIQKLLTKTKEKVIEWHKSSGEDSFMCELSSSSIEIDKIEFGQDILYTCKIFNRNSQLMENFSCSKNDTSDFSVMESLHQIVRRNVLDIDHFLDNLSSELEHLELTSIAKYFPGKWRLDYNGRLTGSEEVEIREDNKYFAKPKNDSVFRYSFNLENISIDKTQNKIEFTKVAVPPYTRDVQSVLNIIEFGKHYEGIEENGAINVSYFKID